MYSARNRGKIAERAHVFDEFQKHAVEPKTQQMSRMYSSHVHALLEEARLVGGDQRQTEADSGADWVMGGKKLPGLKDLFFNMSVRWRHTDVHKCEHILNCTFRITFLPHVNNILVIIYS